MVRLLTTICLIALAACSPLYVMQAAYKESVILWSRQDIKKSLEKNRVKQQLRPKLRLVLEARKHTLSMGLNPADSFTTYAETSDEVLAWVFMAAKKDSFKMRSWWFPIVGQVPYKGFFERSEAEELAKILESEGYESSIRSTDAFSTLGWFNDPVLSTTLKQAPLQIVNTVIHEIVHNSHWIAGQVPFNETLANFVGQQGAKEFYLSKLEAAKASNLDRRQIKFLTDNYKAALESQRAELLLSEALSELVNGLQALYDSDLSLAEKLAEREQIFVTTLRPWRQKYPKAKLLPKINNAEIMQVQIYFTKLNKFLDLFVCGDNSWSAFFDTISEIEQLCDSDYSKCDPYAMLEQNITECRSKLAPELAM